MSGIIAANALSALLLVVTAIFSPAAAFGALAVGSTSNVSKDGIAMGTAINHKTESEARRSALEYCKTYERAKKAAAQCRVIGSFKDECYAISFDPKPQTPGAGWAIAATKTTAEQRAIENCKATAGSDRREFCKIDEAKCDGNAK
jgi:Domain of unknown function (DUF4189)